MAVLCRACAVPRAPRIIPAAEGCGVRMAIHPDDPPMPLLGLPRVVSNAKDCQFLLSAVESPANGLTLCSGSYGAAHLPVCVLCVGLPRAQRMWRRVRPAGHSDSGV